MPFVFEGIILGAAGGGIACLLVMGGSRYVTKLATEIMPLLGQFSSNVDPAQFFGSIVILGCLTGAMGSLISIRKFLKA
jgi:cell division transport system permease protein